jgi:hypothetical protein
MDTARPSEHGESASSKQGANMRSQVIVALGARRQPGVSTGLSAVPTERPA